jgi:hypothetical protein
MKKAGQAQTCGSGDGDCVWSLDMFLPQRFDDLAQEDGFSGSYREEGCINTRYGNKKKVVICE